MEGVVNVLGFDTETTSNQSHTTGVMQLGAVLLKADGTKEVLFNQLCNPRMQVSAEAQAVHGISDEMVIYAELDVDVMQRLYAYIDENKHRVIIMGHNIIGFDLPILWRLGGGGVEIPILWIDTLVAAVRIFPDADSHRLSDLTEWLQLGGTDKAHDAAADIEMVFNLADHMRQGLNKTWEEMALWCMTPRIVRRCWFGKHQGKLWGRPIKGDTRNLEYVPSHYVKFICEKFDHPLPDLVETIRDKYKMLFVKRNKK